MFDVVFEILEIAFKCQTNSFHYKDPIPTDLISGAVYRFECDLCNESYYGESIRHLFVIINSTLIFTLF